MSTARYVVGIDLGTTNTAVAFVDTAASDANGSRVEPLPILQVVRPGVVEARPTLPSFLYLPAASELAPEAVALPWSTPNETPFVVGEFARDHGWRVPIRLVSSAKSWLSSGGVDRTAAILPWQAPDEVPKLSPVDCAARYLEHIRAAWDHRFASEHAPLAEQDIFLTVPASFDAVARELTVLAAHQAGLPHVTLLEEPQAAFYAWLGQKSDGWRTELASGDVVLVCDVGGGTTDFSLIAVTDVDGNLQLERVAVGDHILLGGDNMDLALAHAVRARLDAAGTKLDGWQFASLAHACRRAKEALFADADLADAPVVVLGRSSRVIGGSVNTTLSRDELTQIVGEGFFPTASIGERPARARRIGLRELGLSYASDAAITRHLAAFVGAHRPATAVLFNGGVMKARPLTRRITEALDGWSTSPDDDLKLLTSYDLDLAVAHGAAYYGLVRRGRGIRIRGGTARAYYVGIESAAPAVPGMSPPLKALCVAPRGMEEGTEVTLDGRELGMVLGEPAEFRFLASSTRQDDQAGVLLDGVDDLEELSPVAAVLGDPASPDAGQVIPVTLRSKVTEIGTLELWCVARGGDHHSGDQRWKLEYNVRDIKQ